MSPWNLTSKDTKGIFFVFFVVVVDDYDVVVIPLSIFLLVQKIASKNKIREHAYIIKPIISMYVNTPKDWFCSLGNKRNEPQNV